MLENGLDVDVVAESKDFLLDVGPSLIGAIIVLLVGLKIISWIQNTVGKVMEKREVDASLRPFLNSLMGAILKILLFVSIAGMLGVATTSFVAVIGAAGLAIGLALQGSLANFAGGVLILLLRPFKVGDFITASGHSGTVKEIQIFYTILKTPQNQDIIVPNGQLSNAAVTNFSNYPTRRLDVVFGIGYEDDIDKAKAVIQSVIEADERILKDPAPLIYLETLNDSSVDFKVRIWAKMEDFWNVNFDLTESIKKAFDKEGISIPFPQRDVHLFKND